MNQTFLEEAFSPLEKKHIVNTYVDNSYSQGFSGYHTYAGSSTYDNVFLLSCAEADKYFQSDEERAAGATGFAGSTEAIQKRDRCKWWLRSPGEDSCHAAYIDYKGIYTIFGNHVNVKYSVRPAFRIDMKSKFFRSLLTAGQSGDVVFKNPPQHVPVEIEIRDRDYL